ncbi:MAG TPA: aromatic hydrocarbon degradation protein [Helicobacteraceae bacterium]|nr:aromatic hydrocarbon degradation protein [Helicobacteraceae bacterium]
MKKTIKLALSAAMVLGATSAFATNGDNMIGQGAKSRAMGGVGIAKGFGAESGLANPAMMKSVEKMELMGAATFFMPSVSFRSDMLAASQGAPQPSYADSSSDFSVIPEISFAHRVSDKIVYGLSITGTAGLGVDYSDATFGTAKDNGSFEMKTALQLLKVAIPVSFEDIAGTGIALGVAPIMQYGTLQLSHKAFDPNTGAPFDRESPKASDSTFGYEIGLAYDLSKVGVKGLELGAVYKSPLAMEYKDTIGTSLGDFGASSLITSGDKLEQPAEIGAGIAYNMGGSTIAFDYKNVKWGSAAGYSDFGWEDQNVFALGYEFATKSWALRLGYNYGKSPIAEQDASKGLTPSGVTNYKGGIQNFFNMAGFPGIVEQHITFGGGYNFTESFGLDAAVVYVPEVTASYDTSSVTQGFVAQAAQGGVPVDPNASAPSTADVKHSQMGVTVALSYKF